MALAKRLAVGTAIAIPLVMFVAAAVLGSLTLFYGGLAFTVACEASLWRRRIRLGA